MVQNYYNPRISIIYDADSKFLIPETGTGYTDIFVAIFGNKLSESPENYYFLYFWSVFEENQLLKSPRVWGPGGISSTGYFTNREQYFGVYRQQGILTSYEGYGLVHA